METVTILYFNVFGPFPDSTSEYSEALRMTYQQAINIINAQYPAAVVDYEPDLGWRIVSAEDGSEGRIPLGPYCQDYEQAMVAAAKNLSS
jgi:hypothetical protein